MIAESTPWSEIFELLEPALGETLQMIVFATLFTALGGVLLGVLLHATAPGGLWPQRPLHALLSLIVGVVRSAPFLILMIALIPFTKLVVGKSIGTWAAIVPLVVGSIPFYARIVESALREVPRELVDMARASGASRAQTVRKVLLPEALPGLVTGLTITVVMIVGYTAMAGTVGGGGLGEVAQSYGYERYDTNVMLASLAVLIAIVQLIQLAGDRLARRVSHR